MTSATVLTETDPRLQQVLEGLAARGLRTVEPPESRSPLPTCAAALAGGRLPGWDPHEVWLDRIKRPRDRRPGR